MYVISRLVSNSATVTTLAKNSGLMGTGKSTTTEGILDYLEGKTNIDGDDIVRLESDDYRWEMLSNGRVPESWARSSNDELEGSPLNDAVAEKSKSAGDTNHDIDWSQEVEEVVSRSQVYDELREKALSSEGVVVYDGSIDRNHGLVKDAAESDTDAYVAFHAPRDKPGLNYMDEWGGDSERLLREFSTLLDKHGEVFDEILSWSAEEVAGVAGSPSDYTGGDGRSLKPLLEEIGRVVDTSGGYIDEQYEHSERFKARLEHHIRPHSGRLEEFPRNIGQQEDTIRLAEGLEGIDTFYVEDQNSEEDARYGNRMESPDGGPDELGRRIALAETRKRLSSKYTDLGGDEIEQITSFAYSHPEALNPDSSYNPMERSERIADYLSQS